MILRLSWHEPGIGARVLGYDVTHDLAEAVRTWWRLRRSGRRPRLRLERTR